MTAILPTPPRAKGRKRTVAQYVDDVILKPRKSTTDVIRRKRSSNPSYLSIFDIAAEVVKRGYKVIISDVQVTYILNRDIVICA